MNQSCFTRSEEALSFVSRYVILGKDKETNGEKTGRQATDLILV
jgi:hypothetical protein